MNLQELGWVEAFPLELVSTVVPSKYGYFPLELVSIVVPSKYGYFPLELVSTV